MAHRAVQTRFSKGVRWEEDIRASCGSISSGTFEFERGLEALGALYDDAEGDLRFRADVVAIVDVVLGAV